MFSNPFLARQAFAQPVRPRIGVYLLAPVIRRELGSYLARLQSGEVCSSRQSSQAQAA